MAAILVARDQAGPFQDLADFLKRVKPGAINRKGWESLIKAGVFDQFASRDSLLDNLDQIISQAAKLQRDGKSGQTDLFGSAATGGGQQPTWLTNLSPTEANLPDQYLAWERELLGLYLSKHPLQAYQAYFSKQTNQIADISVANQTEVELVGLIKAARDITTKSGQQMAFVKLEDLSGELDLVVFPDTYARSPDIWQVDKIVRVRGQVKPDNQEPELATLIVGSADLLSSADLVASPTKVYLRLTSSQDTDKLVALKQCLDKYPGQAQVILVLGADQAKQVLRLPQQVKLEPALIDELGALIGQANVKL